MEKVDVAVIGGGCIGMSIAARLTETYKRVVLFDRDQLGREATHASGGMLAPIMELEFDEFEMLELGVKSLRRYRNFALQLQQETGMDLDYKRNGTLFVALQPRHLSDLERLYEYQRRIGLEAEKLTAERLKEKEPLLADNVQAGILVAGEEKIDNRKFSAALAIRCRDRGVEIHSNDPVINIEYGEDGSVDLVKSLLMEVRPRIVVIAAGAFSGLLPGLKPGDQMPVRPVKGQAVAVGISPDFCPRHVVQTPGVYCVPHYPDRLLLGASMEEKGFDRRRRAGGAYDLLFAGTEVMPAIKDQPYLETWTGLRPASRDSRPIIGPSAVTPNLYFATAHYRNGILLTPITTDWLQNCIVEKELPPDIKPFLPARFSF